MQTFQESFDKKVLQPIMSSLHNGEPSISKCELYNKSKVSSINAPVTLSLPNNSKELKRKQEETDIEHSIKRKRKEINEKQKEVVISINKLKNAVTDPFFTKEIIEYNLYTKEFSNTIKIINTLLTMSNTENVSSSHEIYTENTSNDDNERKQCPFIKENQERCLLTYNEKEETSCWRHK